jgi:flavin reductase (DIM6/NTAB) family NADH-FMN oxidoreductase RutF
MIELEVKADRQIHDITKTLRYFVLNVLGKDQQGAAYTILKPDEHEDQRIRGEALHSGSTGTPVMDNTPAFVECRLLTTVEEGEHSIFIGEVGYAGVIQEPEGHADEVTLFLKDLGENKLQPL